MGTRDEKDPAPTQEVSRGLTRHTSHRAARHTYLPTAQERRAVGERRRQQYVQRVQKDDLSKARRTRHTRMSGRPAFHRPERCT